MNNITKQDILESIRQTAKENDGKPLGMERFTHESGIKKYDWQKYWARYSDAIREAGLEPNKLQGAYKDEYLYEKVISVIRKIGKFPTYIELRLQKNHDATFPDRNVFMKYGSKQELANRISKYSSGKKGYESIVLICQSVIENTFQKKIFDSEENKIGEVYLLKSGRYYKIGRTNDTVRRGMEIRIQLPERTDLIHSIKTDDPSGVETYWHNRFKDKRKEGEWFDLKPSDVKAFKRWRRIV